jgi:predicted metal-dependent peptidase
VVEAFDTVKTVNMVGTVPTLLQHRGTRAIQRMVEFAPSSGGLALWVRHDNLPDDAAGAPGQTPGPIPVVATDGQTLFYAAAFERLPLATQAGWVAHAVLHVALRHPQRLAELQRVVGDVDRQLFNVCADAIVNSALAHLTWLQLPSAAVQLDALLTSALGLRMSAESALLEWDVERLYRAIDDRRPAKEGGAKQDDRARAQSDAQAQSGSVQRPSPDREDGPRALRTRALGRQTAHDLLPGTQAQDAPEDEAEQARLWSERLLRAHAGDGERSMLRVLLADVPRSRTPWEQVLRTLLARQLAQQPGLSWSRPARSYIANQGRAGHHRRMPWEPGTAASRTVPKLAVIVDVSGSIDDALMQRFAREIEAISRRLEAALVLIVGDERVQRVSTFEPGRSDLRQIQFKGGGGTDFTPMLEEAQRHRPDITVVLTDLQGPARLRPQHPVVWAVPEAHPMPSAPFGRVLALR